MPDEREPWKEMAILLIFIISARRHNTIVFVCLIFTSHPFFRAINFFRQQLVAINSVNAIRQHRLWQAEVDRLRIRKGREVAEQQRRQREKAMEFTLKVVASHRSSRGQLRRPAGHCALRSFLVSRFTYCRRQCVSFGGAATPECSHQDVMF